MHSRRGTDELLRQLQFGTAERVRRIDSRLDKECLLCGNRRPSQVAIQLNDEKCDGDDAYQKRRERQTEVAAGSKQDSAIRADYNRELILEQAHGKQMCFQPVLG